MADGFCFGSIGFDGYRVTVLDDIGAPLPGTATLFVGGDGISLAAKSRSETGTEHKQKLGNGVLCINRSAPTVVIGSDPTLTVCHWEYELLGAVTGGPVAYDEEGRPFGCALPDPSELVERRVCLEAWSQAVDGEQRGAYNDLAAWHHHAWPSVQFSLGDFTLEDAVAPRVFNGLGSANANIGSGPFGDWPAFDNGDVMLDGEIGGPYAVWLDTEVPEALCGGQELEAVGS